MVMNPLAGIQSIEPPPDGPGVTAIADRQSRMAAWAHGPDGLLKPGVVPGWGSELQVALGSGLTLTIGTGAAILAAPQPGHGGWPLVNEALETKTLQPRHASNNRIDRVIARVADPFYYSGGDKLAALVVLPGTPSATPSLPDVPESEGSFLDLGQVLVPSSASGGPLVLSKHTAADVPRTAPAEMPTPYVIATNSGVGGQSYNSSGTVVQFAGLIDKSVGAFNTSFPSRFYATKSGLYQAHLSLTFGFTGGGGVGNVWVDASPSVSGGGGERNLTAVTVDRNPYHGVQFQAMLRLDEGDYLEWFVATTASLVTRENFGQVGEFIYLGPA